MDFDKKYFYVPVRFDLELGDLKFRNIDEDIYENITAGELFRKRLMYDYGWGQENGFELLPPLSFSELITLLEHKHNTREKKTRQEYSKKENRDNATYNDNMLGAISVIMQDHIEELIDFLSEKINTDYFTNSDIRENFKRFAFSSQKEIEAGRIPGGISAQSYEDTLNKYPKWRKISSQVINQIYR